MATTKESPPQGVCHSQTEVLPCSLQGETSGLLSSANSPGSREATQSRSFFFCAYSVSLEGALSSKLHFPSCLPIPQPASFCPSCLLPLTQVCQCSTKALPHISGDALSFWITVIPPSFLSQAARR